MELYTLTPTFLRDEVVDEFASAIWTDRYSSAGDVELIVPATPEMITRLSPGTFLALEGSDEIMILETHSMKDGVLTITGESLLGFLKHRVLRWDADPKTKDYYMFGYPPGQVLAQIVQNLCIEGPFIDFAYSLTGLDGPNEVIPNLGIGPYDDGGPDIAMRVPFGPLYDALLEIAESYFLGMRLYLSSADEEGYSLLFSSYRGEDRTSLQSTNPLVRFSPDMDSLGNIKELQSVATYKNIAYAFAPAVEGLAVGPGVASSGGTSAELTGFNRRALMVFCDDITNESVGESLATLNEMLQTRAIEALAANNYTKMVDGEIDPTAEFQYGLHYGLGDLIEFQSYSGEFQQVRVTEYIRSQDESGERSYPTVSVVNYEEVNSWIGTD